MKDNAERAKILRYAQLVLKRQTYEKRHLAWTVFVTPEERAEMENIPNELGMTHKKILELASKNVIPEDGGC